MNEKLPHASRPLTEAHEGLLRLVAQIVVDEFLQETEWPERDGGDLQRDQDKGAH